MPFGSILLLLQVATAGTAVPVGDRGPAVGERLPAFEALDQDGNRRNFESLRGPNGLVLVFFRSADW